MQSFLDLLITNLLDKNLSLSNHCVVFPTRRAGLIFKKKFSNHLVKPAFLPVVYSIDDFILSLSPYRVVDATQLLFELFTVYKKMFPEIPFDKFLPWGEMLIKDFNEIDLQLVNAEKLFAHVVSLKEIDALVGISEEETLRIKEFWKLFSNQELTYLQHTFLENWKSLPGLYNGFHQKLHVKNMAYSGMAFKAVADGITNGKVSIPWTKIYFAGFYALSNAEKKIINHLTDKGIAEVYWDADTYYKDNKKQEAGKYFQKRQVNQLPTEFKWNFDFFKNESRNFNIMGVPLHVGQAKYTGILLKKSTEHFSNHDHTVVVLPDEKLLMPVMYALPENTASINITMGYPLQGSHLEQLLRCIKKLADQADKDKTGYSFLREDVISLLENNYIFNIDVSQSKALLLKIKNEKKYLLSTTFFLEENLPPVIKVLFSLNGYSENTANFLSWVLDSLVKHFESTKNKINLRDLGLLTFFNEEMQKLVNLMNDFKNEIDFNATSTWKFLLALIKSVRVPFTGEPVSGLQIMGFLETRNLDFENVFILSMNENVMPGTSQNNSYIPFSIRKAYGLPTYEEQDAIYAYHFYRLLQRAKNIYLLYNTESGGMSGGEMSRYILQIAYELKKSFPEKITLTHKLVGTDLKTHEIIPIRIQKNKEVSDRLNDLFYSEGKERKKWSPTAFTTYITCSLQFYFKYIAGIYKPEEINQEIDAAVFGNIIHLVMEKLYSRETEITAEYITSLIPIIDPLVEEAIRETFPAKLGVLTGKNSLLKTIMVDLIKKILLQDKTESPFTIHGLEKQLLYKISTPGGKVDLVGKIDRIDEVNGITRIIDYKTGKDKTSKKFEIANLFSNSEQKGSFQLMMYSLLYKKNNTERKVKAGIYNLKTINRGIDFLNNGSEITEENVLEFEQYIIETIASIVNPEIDFFQTDTIKHCEWCAYKDICNR